MQEEVNFKNLFGLFKKQGVSEVIISPGSRNAPLIEAFVADDFFNLYSIIDERSAGFFALGLAQQSLKPAILVCTSGSAALNYAPAIAEAYYQALPLIVLSADRPARWINQQEGQSINQNEVFKNYVKASFTLPENLSKLTDHLHAQRIFNEACLVASRNRKGPVHINIPLEEPLYGRADSNYPLRPMHELGRANLNDQELADLSEIWSESQAVMILCGQIHPDESLRKELIALKQKHPGIVVLTESLSNAFHPSFVNCIDTIIEGIEIEDHFRPELLISVGEHLVSKKIKALLRKFKPDYHWSIKESLQIEDTFNALTHKLTAEPQRVLEQLLEFEHKEASEFSRTWEKLNRKKQQLHANFVKTLPFSDMRVFQFFLDAVPEDFQIQMGNSTVVRYAQLFEAARFNKQFGNRGTSGIDGCSSTAVGAAVGSNEPVVLITGDVAFQYDSNAFLNDYVSSKLRVLVINNAGGNIFKIIPGPENMDAGRGFLESPHAYTAEAIAKRSNMIYQRASSMSEFQEALDNFFKLDAQSAVVLEVFTDSELSATTLKAYFKHLKSQA